jgi:hypothetical protein
MSAAPKIFLPIYLTRRLSQFHLVECLGIRMLGKWTINLGRSGKFYFQISELQHAVADTNQYSTFRRNMILPFSILSWVLTLAHRHLSWEVYFRFRHLL